MFKRFFHTLHICIPIRLWSATFIFKDYLIKKMSGLCCLMPSMALWIITRERCTPSFTIAITFVNKTYNILLYHRFFRVNQYKSLLQQKIPHRSACLALAWTALVLAEVTVKYKTARSYYDMTELYQKTGWSLKSIKYRSFITIFSA